MAATPPPYPASDMKSFKQLFDMKIMREPVAPSTVVNRHWRGWQRPGQKLPRQCTSAHLGRGNSREAVSLAASVNAVGGLDGVTRPTQVNCHNHRQRNGAKDADRLQPKGIQPGARPIPCARTGNTAVGGETGAKSLDATRTKHGKPFTPPR